MSVTTEKNQTKEQQKTEFKYLIVIRPLGFLYGSAGRFLSPENLVGRSGTNFPPSAATLSGIFAYEWENKNKEKLNNLQLAGPFWAEKDKPENFYVPTPLHCLVKENQIKHLLFWQEEKEKEEQEEKGKWQTLIDGKWKTPPNDKFQSGTWVAIANWHQLQTPEGELPEVKTNPWKFLPHLHPKLKEDERHVVDDSQGSLFLENAVQLDPNVCLVYLSNIELPSGWYRFGGEGHLVDIQCQPMGKIAQNLFSTPLGDSFALITPGVWGSNRFSYRAPLVEENTGKLFWQEGNEVKALLTGRTSPFRYRLGDRLNEQQQDADDPNNKAKLLSRGRYIVPAGSVYVLEQSLTETWQQLDEDLFPFEGYSCKRWGFGLALPLSQ